MAEIVFSERPQWLGRDTLHSFIAEISKGPCIKKQTYKRQLLTPPRNQNQKSNTAGRVFADVDSESHDVHLTPHPV